MLRSESCDVPSLQPLKLPNLAPSRAAKADSTDEKDDANSTQKAAQGFASVLYSQLFQEMQRTIPKAEDDGEDGEEANDAGLGESAQDFLGMYLPAAISDQGSDPVSRSIAEYLKAQHGEKRNE